MMGTLSETASNAFQSALSSLVPISLVLLAQKRVLEPQYGSYPTVYSLDFIVLAAILASAFKPFKVKTTWNWLTAGIFLAIAPNASYWVAVWTTRQRWPVLGPAIAHVAVVAPLVFVFTNFIMQSTPTIPSTFHRLLKSSTAYFIPKLLAERVWLRVVLLNDVSESQIFLALAGIAFSAFIVHLDYSSSSQTKARKRGNELTTKSSLSSTHIKASLLATFGALWYIMSPSFANPILSHPVPETFTHPSGRLQIHSAVRSVTGLIVVGDTLPSSHPEDEIMHSARYLRADHSLLGGVWMNDRATALEGEPYVEDFAGNRLGDTVYSTFVLQEATRLVDSTKAGKTGNFKNALTIGLGTGFSTSAFIRHGLNTTIVEIDPAVYDAARTWFALPDPGPGNVFLEDARQFVGRRAKEIKAGTETRLYDIVVHDCFSGGGVPEHIFTSEFWSTLKEIMDAEGVLAVNFAGVANSPSSKMILHTLENNFKQCCAFHDWMRELKEDKYDEEFINVVFFCTDSEVPMTFRKPKRADYLGSHLRKHIFQGLESRRINLDVIREKEPQEAEKYILTDRRNPLGDLQRKQGVHHWEVMRHVLNDIHWETY